MGATARAERGYHPGLFEVPDHGHTFSVDELYRYWNWFRWEYQWEERQGKVAEGDGGPLDYRAEDWKLKVPLEYLT